MILTRSKDPRTIKGGINGSDQIGFLFSKKKEPDLENHDEAGKVSQPTKPDLPSILYRGTRPGVKDERCTIPLEELHGEWSLRDRLVIYTLWLQRLQGMRSR